jgi:hypothetical protein
LAGAGKIEYRKIKNGKIESERRLKKQNKEDQKQGDQIYS